MRGYRMVLLVNGGVFLLIALATLAYGQLLVRPDASCTHGDNETLQRCADQQHIADETPRIALLLASVGLVLLVLGVFLGRAKPPQA